MEETQLVKPKEAKDVYDLLIEEAEAEAEKETDPELKDAKEAIARIIGEVKANGGQPCKCIPVCRINPLTGNAEPIIIKAKW